MVEGDLRRHRKEKNCQNLWQLEKEKALIKTHGRSQPPGKALQGSLTHFFCRDIKKPYFSRRQS
jgi:hypothetical protein